MRKGKPRQDIIIKPEVRHEIGLPKPYVLYLGRSNPFLLFSDSQNGPFYYCSCMIPAYTECSIDTNFISWKKNLPQPQFEENLCHRCNQRTPVPEYCHKMYGGVFKRKYGWYIKLNEWANKSRNSDLNQDITFYMSEISTLRTSIESLLNKYKSVEIKEGAHGSSYEWVETDFTSMQSEKYDDNKSVYDHFRDMQKMVTKLERSKSKIIENKTRLEFGHKKVGEYWVSETIVYNICKEMYPDYRVIFHYKPAFLEGMEIDVFITELNIGLEYQGIQHYKAIEHFGGSQALEGVKARDKRKKKLCLENGVTLIEIKYDENISTELICDKINSNKNG